MKGQPTNSIRWLVGAKHTHVHVVTCTMKWITFSIWCRKIDFVLSWDYMKKSKSFKSQITPTRNQKPVSVVELVGDFNVVLSDGHPHLQRPCRLNLPLPPQLYFLMVLLFLFAATNGDGSRSTGTVGVIPHRLKHLQLSVFATRPVHSVAQRPRRGEGGF